MPTKRPKTIATCPHCGCSIYSRETDENGLPVPEYICQCRFMAACAGRTAMPYYPTPIYPIYPAPIYPHWWPTVTCGGANVSDGPLSQTQITVTSGLQS